mgnify:CR=1 FL=1
MLRMKKAKAEAAALAAATTTPMETDSNDKTIFTKAEEGAQSGGAGSGGLKLLGVGGKSGTGTGDKKSVGKKRTPGEIRIQKGNDIKFIDLLIIYLI